MIIGAARNNISRRMSENRIVASATSKSADVDDAMRCKQQVTGRFTPANLPPARHANSNAKSAQHPGIGTTLFPIPGCCGMAHNYMHTDCGKREQQ